MQFTVWYMVDYELKSHSSYTDGTSVDNSAPGIFLELEIYTVKTLITDSAGEFKFCPL
jgi:hypothetical protein